MIPVFRANEDDAALISRIAIPSFIESHGASAPEADIRAYTDEKYNAAAIRLELQDKNNFFHIIHYRDQPAGYSKMILNLPYAQSPFQNMAKLERIYLLQAFYGLKLGLELLHTNMELAKAHNQSGLWLYVWKGNTRAIQFYNRAGFEITGSYDFPISKNHFNPNHQMLLKF